MLFANKQNLETELKVSLLGIRERELNLYTDNCRNIASCCALLAGFSYTALVSEKHDTFSNLSDSEKAVYNICTYLSLYFNTAAMFGATTCAMLGPGLALRGADGAMDQAVEGLALEYRTTFVLFFGGVVSYFFCFVIFIVMDFEPGDWFDAFLHFTLIACFLLFLRSTIKAIKRIYKKFRLPPECAVSGAFDPDGTWRRGASPETLELEQLSENKVWYQWPRRQYARMPPPHAHRTSTLSHAHASSLQVPLPDGLPQRIRRHLGEALRGEVHDVRRPEGESPWEAAKQHDAT